MIKKIENLKEHNKPVDWILFVAVSLGVFTILLAICKALLGSLDDLHWLGYVLVVLCSISCGSIFLIGDPDEIR